MKRRVFVTAATAQTGLLGLSLSARGSKSPEAYQTAQLDEPAPIASPAQVHSVGRSGNYIFSKDQEFTTPYDRLRAAISGSGPGDTIVGEAGQTIEIPSSDTDEQGIRFRSFTRFLGNGAIFSPKGEMDFAVATEPNASDVELKDVFVDCGGNAERQSAVRKAGLFIEGGRNIWLVDCKVRNFSAYAIQATVPPDGGLSGVHIIRPQVHSPAKGSSFAVFANAKAGQNAAEDVYVEGGDFWGTDPRNPVHGDYSADNAFTGDYVTYHGVRNGHISHCNIRYSGSAAITLSRGCDNIVVSDVLASVCYEPAVNVGSGFMAIHVDSLAGFEVSEEKLIGPVELEGRIVAMRADQESPGGWLWLAPVRYGVFQEGDEVTQNNAVARITKSPPGSHEPGLSIIPSARNISLHNITALDTVIQGKAAVFNFIHTRGADTAIHNCSADEPRGLGRAEKFLSSVHSNVGLGDNNRWRGRPVDAELIAAGSGNSIWNYVQADGVGFIASARMAAAGRMLLAKNVNIEKIAKGKYGVTFKRPIESRNYQVLFETHQADIVATAPMGARTEEGFEIMVRDVLSDTMVDGPLAFVVAK